MMTEIVLKPFEGDSLNRREYASGLIDFIEKLNSGVIAIDGEWGVGKSWLGNNIKKLIDEKMSASTVWIDAFESDWDEDPSLSLIANIASQTADGSVNAAWLKETASNLARLIPAGVKAAAHVAGNIAGIDKDVVDDLSDAIKDGGDLYIEKRLKDLVDKRKTLTHLKQLLTNAVNQTPTKKVVVFIDELDRCSPEYAIRFLERLKHLFDLENVVYVLFWNRSQIQHAVEVFYGSSTNGQMYLDKFIDFPLYLPLSHVRNGDGSMSIFLNSLISKFNEFEQSSLMENYKLLNAFCTLLSLTARETERLARWWVMSLNRNVVILETWLLGLKIKHPDLFARIRNGDATAHLEVKQLLGKMLTEDQNLKNLISPITEIHDRYNRNDFTGMNIEASNLLGRGLVEYRNVIPAAIRRLETFK